jgi:hypothetical protein
MMWLNAFEIQSQEKGSVNMIVLIGFVGKSDYLKKRTSIEAFSNLLSPVRFWARTLISKFSRSEA